MKLETGICGEQSVRVSAENTAKTMGSGTLDVFATPALVALAEKTCWQSVAPALEAGSGTVGTKLELEHTAPTPVGMTVTCHSELVAVEGRKLTFKVTLADEKGPVGGGTHERFIIFEEKFAAKAEPKRAKNRPVLFRPAAAAASLRPAAAARRGSARPAKAAQPAHWRGTVQSTWPCNPARCTPPLRFCG